MIQGLTEFLPVSSSGHLALFQSLFGIEEPPLFYDLLLHTGTLCAVGVIFRSDFIDLAGRLSDGVSSRRRRVEWFREAWQRDEVVRLWTLVAVGSIPTFIMGLLVHDSVEEAFHSHGLVGTFLILTGLILAISRWRPGGGKELLQVGLRDALIIGTAQGFALFPGVSRSGITIVAGLLMGLQGMTSARFSFLLSVPAILGGTAFELIQQKGLSGGFNPAIELVGFLVAFLSGLFALKAVIDLVGSGRLYLFSFYCLALVLALLILS